MHILFRLRALLTLEHVVRLYICSMTNLTYEFVQCELM